VGNRTKIHWPAWTDRSEGGGQQRRRHRRGRRRDAVRGPEREEQRKSDPQQGAAIMAPPAALRLLTSPLSLKLGRGALQVLGRQPGFRGGLQQLPALSRPLQRGLVLGVQRGRQLQHV